MSVPLPAAAKRTIKKILGYHEPPQVPPADGVADAAWYDQAYAALPDYAKRFDGFTVWGVPGYNSENNVLWLMDGIRNGQRGS